MPYKREYNARNVKVETNKDSAVVMGGNPKPAKLPAPQWKSRPTGNKQFPEGI